MILLNARQIHEWDSFTITHEPIASIDLMERAARRCVEQLLSQKIVSGMVKIFCGRGNNGGDGLAIARMLGDKGMAVQVFILHGQQPGSPDFETNLGRLKEKGIQPVVLNTSADFPSVSSRDLVVDAVFGSGLNRPLQGLAAELIVYLNQCAASKLSIDLPSGMYLDASSKGNTVFRADDTFTFQRLKFCFLLPENHSLAGRVQVLDIGLDKNFPQTLQSDRELVDQAFAGGLYRPRNPFGHKGTFGHVLLVAGNPGKMGAALMAAHSCLRSGVGLLTCALPESEQNILPLALPEAMSQPRSLSMDLSRYAALAVGPGLGTDETTLLEYLLHHCQKPMVLDADALNMIARHKEWLELIPEGSVLTPHPKEFERLFGPSANDAERIAQAIALSEKYPFALVLKGHYSLTAYAGRGYFNTTGNSGLATGGSGDTLTGIIAALLAQGYPARDAAIMGIYLHGLAADLALEKESEESLLPSDLCLYLGRAFKKVKP